VTLHFHPIKQQHKAHVDVPSTAKKKKLWDRLAVAQNSMDAPARQSKNIARMAVPVMA